MNSTSVKLKLHKHELDLLRFIAENMLLVDTRKDEIQKRVFQSNMKSLMTKFQFDVHSKSKKFSRTFKYHELFICSNVLQSYTFHEPWAMAAFVSVSNKINHALIN